MGGWILRVRDRQIPLGEGTHVIGRDGECQVQLDDDELISRQHAELTVRPEGVTLRDLGSRNGVHLKQRRLAPLEAIEIRHGDTFVVGQTTLALMRRRERRIRTIEAKIDSSPPSSVPPGASGPSKSYEALLAEADRCFARGDLDRFAGATHLLIEALTAALDQGGHDEPAVAAATRHALRLAEMRGVEWIDQLLALYDSVLLVPSIETVTALQRLFAIHHWRCARLDRYVERIAPVLADAGPRGRALLGQLESLRRQQT